MKITQLYWCRLLEKLIRALELMSGFQTIRVIWICTRENYKHEEAKADHKRKDEGGSLCRSAFESTAHDSMSPVRENQF